MVWVVPVHGQAGGQAVTTHRWRRAVQGATLLLLFALLLAVVAAYANAVRHWRAARQALAVQEWSQARQRLDHCRWLWAYNPAWHWAYARASRGLGDLTAARQHLLQAEQSGYHDSQAIALERALVRYQQGDDTVEPYLWQQYEVSESEQAAVIAAALVPRLWSQFRLPEAGPLSAQWVQQCPESALAWRYRAWVLERLHPNGVETVEAWRRWLTLAPHEREARLGLARLLLQRRESLEQASALLQEQLQYTPEDESALLLLAECRLFQGEREVALQLLDGVIASGTKEARAYWLRGRERLHASATAQAVADLRQAATLDPSSPDIWYSLFQALQQSGAAAEEVRQVEQRWRQCEADLRLAGQLARRIGEQPRDPELRRQLGELFLRNGRHADGLRWLHSALQIRPDYPDIHRLLADYYDRQGRPDLAAPHHAALASPRR